MNLPALLRPLPALLPALLLAACGGGSDSARTGTGALSTVSTWMYQLTDLEDPAAIAALVQSPYELVVIDDSSTVAGLTHLDVAGDVAALQQSGKLVFAYLNVGQVESYRDYWQPGWETNPPSWILANDPDGWDDNFTVVFWHPEFRAILADAIDRAAAAGFDGLFLDWLLIYEQQDVRDAAAGLGVSTEDLLEDHVEWVRARFRQRRPGGMVVAQNSAELGTRASYRGLFDAIVQEAIWFDGPGDPDTSTSHGDLRQPASFTAARLDELRAWSDAGVPVFHVEYCEDPNHTSEAYAAGASRGFRGLCTLRLLDELTRTPPPWL